MAGEDDGETLIEVFAEATAQPFDALDVEALLGFVHDQQAARADERGGEGESAALARRQRRWKLASLRDELHLFEDVVDKVVRIFEAVGTREEVEVLDYSQVGEEVEVVDDGGKISTHLRVRLGELVAADLDAAFVGAVGTHEAAENGRLAGAVASHECDCFARSHLDFFKPSTFSTMSFFATSAIVPVGANPG